MPSRVHYHILFLLSLSTLLQAQNTPKLGLALSGGGAKGLAHIGVLKVLEEEGIYPDFVTGTSMGSIVGGLYAIGYTPAELEKLAKEIDWDYYFNDDISRIYKPIEEKNATERYQFSFELEDGQLQIPKGFIQGDKLVLLLTQLTAPAHHITDFDNFIIPFRAVAMDLATGDAVVFDDGRLVDALRASMSIPSVFEPVTIDGKLLADGGWVRNLPVEDALQMGADSVIAVDVGGPLYEKEEITSLVAVLTQTGSYRIVESTEEQLKLADRVIAPNIEGLSSLDFTKVDTIIARGEAAARKMLPELRHLMQNLGRDSTHKPDRSAVRKPTSFEIVEVNAGEQDTTSKALLRLCQLNTPAEFSAEEIMEAVTRLYALDFYNNLRYQILPCDGKPGYELNFSGDKKSNTVLQVGLGYDSDYKAAMLLNTTFRNIGLEGSRLSVDLRVSENPALLGQYLLYTKARPSFGIDLKARINFYPGFFYENSQLKNTFGMQHNVLDLNAFSGVTNNLYISLGIGMERYFQRPKLFLASSENVRLIQQYLSFRALRDTYNRLYYPTLGSRVEAFAKGLLNSRLRLLKSSEEDTRQSIEGGMAMARVNKIFPLGEKLTLHWFGAGGAAWYSEYDFINLFYLGRMLPYEESHLYFAGYRYMERPASSFLYTGLRWQWEYADNYFASFIANYGRYTADDFDFSIDESSISRFNETGEISGIGVELGLLSRFGPLRFTTEYNFEEHDFSFIIRGGYAF